MSEQFNNKDYGEYFSAIEKSIERKSKPVTQKVEEVQISKDIFGGVFKLRPWVCITAVVLVLTIIIIALPKKPTKKDEVSSGAQNTNNAVENVKVTKDDLFAKYNDDTAEVTAEVKSQNVIVVNCDKNTVVAARDADVRCYPASTTKIMTILTAVDYISDYTDTFTFSYEITDPLYKEKATLAGFANEESASMTDMFYGAILPSGADATAGIATKIAGSEEEFVKLMNKKAQKLGLKNTNFTNVSGLFDENHYTTPEDMAVIVRAAMKNEICRRVLSAFQHTTTPTPQHPDGITLTSTLFSYMYGTEPEGADILGGKTGFVNESGYCIASFGQSDSGDEYVCVTLKGTSVFPSVKDQIKLYTLYAK